MVKLHIKKGNDSCFLFEATVNTEVEDLLAHIVSIQNGRLKADRISQEISELADHGTSLPVNMQGLADEQIVDLKLKDPWAEKCVPSGGFECNIDEIGRRNGNAPNSKMKEILLKTVQEAKAMISKNLVEDNIYLTPIKVKEAIDIMRGAVMIVYPMGLPPHDPIQQEFDNTEDLSGTQASKEVMDMNDSSLWFCGKELLPGKKLHEFVGKNEKTKIILKLQKKGSGRPAREPVVTEAEQKAMMSFYHKKQEDMKKLNENEEDAYLNSPWSDPRDLSRQFQGLNNIKWR